MEVVRVGERERLLGKGERGERRKANTSYKFYIQKLCDVVYNIMGSWCVFMTVHVLHRSIYHLIEFIYYACIATWYIQHHAWHTNVRSYAV